MDWKLPGDVGSFKVKGFLSPWAHEGWILQHDGWPPRLITQQLINHVSLPPPWKTYHWPPLLSVTLQYNILSPTSEDWYLWEQRNREVWWNLELEFRIPRETRHDQNFWSCLVSRGILNSLTKISTKNKISIKADSWYLIKASYSK